MADPLLSLLGLARRAGRLSLGFDAVQRAADCHAARAVLTAADLSDRTARAVEAFCNRTGVKMIPTVYPIEEFGGAVGQRVGVLSIDDAGFARRVRELCRSQTEGGMSL